MAETAVRESLTIAGRPDRARVARAFVGEVLGLGHPCGDVAVLLVSELFSNSVRHSGSGLPGGMVTVTVATKDDVVRVEVSAVGLAAQWQPDQDMVRNTGFIAAGATFRGVRASAPISSRRCRSSRCGKITANFAARTCPASSMPPIPQQHARNAEPPGYFTASPKRHCVLLRRGLRPRRL